MNYTIVYPKIHTIRQLYKDVPLVTEHGFEWEPNGTEEVSYEVSLNLAAVEEMAHKAAENHGQISRAGPLRIRVLKRARIS